MRIKVSDLRRFIAREITETLTEKDAEDEWPDREKTVDPVQPSEPWQYFSKKKKRDPKNIKPDSRQTMMQYRPDPEPIHGKPDWSMSAADLRTKAPWLADHPDNSQVSRELYRQSRATTQAKHDVPRLSQALYQDEPQNDADYEMPGDQVMDLEPDDRPAIRPRADYGEKTNIGRPQSSAGVTDIPRVTPLKQLKDPEGATQDFSATHVPPEETQDIEPTSLSKPIRRRKLGSVVPKGF